MSGDRDRLMLFTAAGVFTAPNFLDEFREAVAARLEAAGHRVVASCSIFPYGDWSRSRFRQAAEVTMDVCYPAVGGRKTAAEIVKSAKETGCRRIVLIGHSGGGVAGAHAADKLRKVGFEVGAVVMIGSPKAPIARSIRDKTAYFYGLDKQGMRRDPIARLGRWMGKPPALMEGICLIGGHPDYFRARPPYVNESGESNLAVTLNAVGNWLKRCLG